MNIWILWCHAFCAAFKIIKMICLIYVNCDFIYLINHRPTQCSNNKWILLAYNHDRWWWWWFIAKSSLRGFQIVSGSLEQLMSRYDIMTVPKYLQNSEDDSKKRNTTSKLDWLQAVHLLLLLQVLDHLRTTCSFQLRHRLMTRQLEPGETSVECSC